MQKTFLALTLLLVSAGALAAPNVLRKSGDRKLQAADTFDDKKVVIAELANPDVQVTCKFRGGDFFDEFTLFANPSISNKSGRKLNVAYHVAFFDKGELIACAEQSGDVESGAKEYQFGSCPSKLSQEESAKITSYKVVVYVGEPKKKG